MLYFYTRKVSPRVIVLPVVIIMVLLFAPFCRADECSPLQMSLWPAIQLVSQESSICGFRLDLGWGKNREVAGLDLGIANSAESMKGIQIGVLNLVHAAGQLESWGFQLAVVNDTDNARYAGLQVGLIFNSNVGDVRGLQIAISNTARDMDGIQIALGNSTRDMDGVQIALGNNTRDVHGVQIAIDNYARDVHGVQIAVGNSAGDLHGVQIGVLNKCGTLEGVQIGVVNIVTSRPGLDSGRIVPIVNLGF